MSLFLTAGTINKDISKTTFCGKSFLLYFETFDVLPSFLCASSETKHDY